MLRVSVAACFVLSGGIFAFPSRADIVDSAGRIWRSPNSTTNVSRDQVASVCPTDGQTPGSGSAGGRDFTGWIWATRDQVRDMFAEWEPGMTSSDSVSGAQYVLSAMFFTDAIGPTYKFHIVSTSYQEVTGMTASVNPDDSMNLAWVAARWPAFDGSWSVAGGGSGAPSPYIGVWLWRPGSVAGDVDGDGDVDLTDLSILLTNFGLSGDATRAQGDLNGDGNVDLADLSELLSHFGS